MKKVLIFSLMMGWAFCAYSQDVIQLEETKLTFEPSAKVIFKDYANGKLVVEESYAKQFEGNAIKFLTENFDINQFIRENNIEKTDRISVSISSPNGFLKADYDGEGELRRTFQKFRDLRLPLAVMEQVQDNYRSWIVLKNKYMATSKGSQINSEKFVIHVQNGKMKDRLVIQPKAKSDIGSIGLASND